MKYIEIEESIFIPANKICEIIKDQEKDNVLTFWLDGGQVQKITFADKEDRDSNYKSIVNLLKEM